MSDGLSFRLKICYLHFPTCQPSTIRKRIDEQLAGAYNCTFTMQSLTSFNWVKI